MERGGEGGQEEDGSRRVAGITKRCATKELLNKEEARACGASCRIKAHTVFIFIFIDANAIAIAILDIIVVIVIILKLIAAAAAATL